MAENSEVIGSRDVYVADANDTLYLARQIGWAPDDDLARLLDIDATSDDYLVTLEQAEEEGGVKPEYTDKMRPVYVLEEKSRVRSTERMRLNPEPLKAVPVKTCIGCGMRAPWCKCGAGDYR